MPELKSACPICHRPAAFAEPPVGPFCSQRCKLVDLGKWLGENYRIAEPLRADDFAEYEALTSEQP